LDKIRGVCTVCLGYGIIKDCLSKKIPPSVSIHLCYYVALKLKSDPSWLRGIQARTGHYGNHLRDVHNTHIGELLKGVQALADVSKQLPDRGTGPLSGHQTSRRVSTCSDEDALTALVDFFGGYNIPLYLVNTPEFLKIWTLTPSSKFKMYPSKVRDAIVKKAKRINDAKAAKFTKGSYYTLLFDQWSLEGRDSIFVVTMANGDGTTAVIDALYPDDGHPSGKKIATELLPKWLAEARRLAPGAICVGICSDNASTCVHARKQCAKALSEMKSKGNMLYTQADLPDGDDFKQLQAHLREIVDGDGHGYIHTHPCMSHQINCFTRQAVEDGKPPKNPKKAIPPAQLDAGLTNYAINRKMNAIAKILRTKITELGGDLAMPATVRMAGNTRWSSYALQYADIIEIRNVLRTRSSTAPDGAAQAQVYAEYGLEGMMDFFEDNTHWQKINLMRDLLDSILAAVNATQTECGTAFDAIAAIDKLHKVMEGYKSKYTEHKHMLGRLHNALIIRFSDMEILPLLNFTRLLNPHYEILHPSKHYTEKDWMSLALAGDPNAVKLSEVGLSIFLARREDPTFREIMRNAVPEDASGDAVLEWFRTRAAQDLSLTTTQRGYFTAFVNNAVRRVVALVTTTAMVERRFSRYKKVWRADKNKTALDLAYAITELMVDRSENCAKAQRRNLNMKNGAIARAKVAFDVYRGISPISGTFVRSADLESTEELVQERLDIRAIEGSETWEEVLPSAMRPLSTSQPVPVYQYRRSQGDAGAVVAAVRIGADGTALRTSARIARLAGNVTFEHVESRESHEDLLEFAFDNDISGETDKAKADSKAKAVSKTKTVSKPTTLGFKTAAKAKAVETISIDCSDAEDEEEVENEEEEEAEQEEEEEEEEKEDLSRKRSRASRTKPARR
jgi:hypothetical protein